MPSVRNLFRKNRSKSCPDLDLADIVVKPEERENSEDSQNLEDVVEKKSPKKSHHNSFSSLGRKPAKAFKKSLRSLLTRRSSGSDWVPSADKDPILVLEDSSRTAETADSQENGSVTDTSVTMTPPRSQEKATLVMEEVEEEIVDAAEGAVEKETVLVMDAVEEEKKEEEDNTAVEDIEREDMAVDEEKTEGSVAVEVEPENKNEEDAPQDGTTEECSGVVAETVTNEETLEMPSEVEEPPAEATDVAMETEGKENEEFPTETQVSVEEQLIPMPPVVARNEDLLNLLKEANIHTEVNDEEVHRMVEEAGLNAIEEADETEGAAVTEQIVAKKVVNVTEEEEEAKETEQKATKKDFIFEAEFDTFCESQAAPDSMDARKVRDSIVVAKETTGTAGNSFWSPLVIVLVSWLVLASIIVTFLVMEGRMEVLTDLKTHVSTHFQQAVEEVPEDNVRQERSHLWDACRGVYCGFY